MTHLIDSIAYQNETPWHGLGNRVDYDQIKHLEPELLVAKFQEAAGLNWTILESPLAYRDHERAVKVSETHKALVRSDNGYQLSIVGSGYNVVQPREIMTFFTGLLDSGVQIDVAGSLDLGRKVWCLATNPSAEIKLGVDVIKPYIQLVTSCDGSMATCAYYTSVRVVCNNTLQMSRGDMKHGVRVSHRSTFNADDVKHKLGLREDTKFQETIEAMASKKFTNESVAEVIDLLFAKRNEAGEITNESRVKKVTSEIFDSVFHSPGADLSSSHGTLWGLMNGITHWVDYKSGAKSDNNRFKSSQFGDGAKLKNKAFDAIAELV